MKLSVIIFMVLMFAFQLLMLRSHARIEIDIHKISKRILILEGSHAH